MRPSSMSRRRFLQGVLGGSVVSVGLPFFDSWLDPTLAYGQQTLLPKRFGLFFWGNGMLPPRWVPEGTGASWELSDQLAPLASVKDLISVVTGLEIKTPNVEPHHSGSAGILTGQPLRIMSGHKTFAGPSLDQIVAAEIGGETRFRSLEYGAKPNLGLSYLGPDLVNPAEDSPTLLFERIFGVGFREPGDESVVDPSLAYRRSVLDAVMEDTKRFQKKLGVRDSMRLEQHLEGIRELELRIARLEEDPPNLAACAKPSEPAAAYDDLDGRPQLGAKNRAMCDIMAMALACDQTRVFSNYLTSPLNNLLFSGTDAGHHQLTHDEPGEQPQVHAIVLQIIEQLAYMVESLHAVPEGDGTLLDNCLVLATSDVSYGRTHSLDEFPLILAGSAQGQIKQGIHHRSTNRENTSKLMLTLVRAMGIDAPHFGAEEGRVTDGFSDIEI
jgi:hypothetical protein